MVRVCWTQKWFCFSDIPPYWASFSVSLPTLRTCFAYTDNRPILHKSQMATANVTVLWELEVCWDPKTNWMGGETLTVIIYLNLFTSPLWTQITRVRFFLTLAICTLGHTFTKTVQRKVSVLLNKNSPNMILWLRRKRIRGEENMLAIENKGYDLKQEEAYTPCGFWMLHKLKISLPNKNATMSIYMSVVFYVFTYLFIQFLTFF
jgi:hypothetical protein